MLEKIKTWKPLQMGMLALSMGFVFLAEISASTVTGFLWYEPDCPEELIKY
jgi:cyclic lactone autoinducer peptide